MEQASKKAQPIYVIIAGIIIAIITIAFLMSSNSSEEPVQQPEKLEPQVVEVPTVEVSQPVIIESDIPEQLPEPEPEPEPVIEITSEEPEVIEEELAEEDQLPSLAESDNWLKQQMLDMVIDLSASELLMNSDLISNFVVFVDNAAQGDLATKFSPLKEPNDSFKAVVIDSSAKELEYQLDEANFHRYDLHARFIESFSGQQSLDFYTKVKPIINEAYQQLGYEEDDFDDKLVTTIDLLLATPPAETSTTLVTPSAMYEYKNSDLESLYPIQKLLVRMGPTNQQKVQNALRRFKQAFTQTN